jgi:hypothetical protein
MDSDDIEITPGSSLYARRLWLRLRLNAIIRIMRYLLVPFLGLLSIGIFASSISSIYKIIINNYCNYKSDLETNACHGAAILGAFFIYMGVMITIIAVTLFVIACKIYNRSRQYGRIIP